MPYFQESRNIELSVIEYLETQINANWSNVIVVKSFTNAYKEELPVVCIRVGSIYNNRREIGDVTLINDYEVNIDIFAKSDGQRIDLANFILNQINEGCIYYEYSQNPSNTETLNKNANGRITLMRFVMNQPLDFGEDADKHDHFRHFISVQMRKSE